jgi:Bacterial regulatory proteins, gntR family
VAELAQHYGVARNTIIKALRRMADEGLDEIVPNWERSWRGTRSADRDTGGAPDRAL